MTGPPSDQSRGFNFNKRTQDNTESGTSAHARPTRFRLSTTSSFRTGELDNGLEGQQPRKAPSSYHAPTLRNNDDNHRNYSQAQATRAPFARRRQVSTNTASLSQNTDSSAAVTEERMLANAVTLSYNDFQPTATSDYGTPFMDRVPDNSHNYDLDYSGQVTKSQEQKELETNHFSMFTEPTLNFDDFHDNIRVKTETSTSTPPEISLFLQMPELNGARQSPDRKISLGSTIPAPSRKVSASGIGAMSRKNSVTSNTGRNYLPKSDPNNPAQTNPTTVLRGRRQSQFPPSAFNNVGPTQPVKAPRKSVGPGTFTAPETSVSQVKRNPSVGGRKSSTESQRDPRVGKLQTQNLLNGNPEDSKSARQTKTKSALVSSKNPGNDGTLASRTPDPAKSVGINGQLTPGKGSGTPGRPPSPPSRRVSIPSGHATGLGARTISPTDARRMKRMSMMPTAPPVPNRRISQAPPTPQPDPSAALPLISAQSPALPNRKGMHTPSSSRTTPDPNRKSYSSGQSLSSNTSYNSGIPPPQIVPSKQLVSIPGSRLTTPKPLSDTTPKAGEEIPPVPAIPKSYDSPVSEVEQPFFSARNSALEDADTSVADSIAAELANAMAMMDLAQSASRHEPKMSDNLEFDQPAYPDASWSLQPERFSRTSFELRLPPINLPPIDTVGANSMDPSKRFEVEPPGTPPGMNGGTRTPITPMTASKATFASKHRSMEGSQKLLRSSTSHYAIRQDHSMYNPDGLALPPFQFEADDVVARSMSPYISSSLPKDDADFGGLMHSYFTTELKRTGTLQKPNGPRAPSYSMNSPASEQSSTSTLQAGTNGSTTALSRKRSESKLADVSEELSNAVLYDSMPPPRLPASATWSNLSTRATASSSQETTSFRARRKASASNTNLFESAATPVSTMTNGASARPSVDSLHTPIMTQTNRSGITLGQSSVSSSTLSAVPNAEDALDVDDQLAEEEMRKLASKRRDLEAAAKKLDSLRARARPIKRITPTVARQTYDLNIYERGEIIDYPDVYFTGSKSAKKVLGDPSSTSTNFGYDDERGDYNIVEGDHISYRYEVIDILGKGSFGQVVRCIDHKTGQLVAIKIIRNKKRFHQQARVEVDILQKLRDWDPHKQHNVVSFDQDFYFRGHLCISTDLLDMNLYEFIKVHDFRGFSLKLIRRFTKQMLTSLVLLHGKRVIHCDLKPENILLVHPAHADIKVIDFGSSCFENEKVYTYIQSRFYRSPEVILGLSYGLPIDMWSLGCILAELYTGYPIFPGENEQEQLACIMEVFGPPEKHLISKSGRKRLFFDTNDKPRITVSSKGKRRRPSSKDLRSVLRCDDEAFLDFITRCLRWDPAKRLTPADAMNHPFVTGTKAAATRRANTAFNSPLKRGASTHLNGSSTRPLPQPPAASGLKPLLTASLSTISPSKPVVRRQSTAVASSGAFGSATAKRASDMAMTNSRQTGTTRVLLATSSSARPHGMKADMAAAAAAASLVRQS